MPYKTEDHITPGMRINKLTCIEPTGEEGRFGMTKWKVKCDCGTELIADESSLKRHHIRSCGLCDGNDGLIGQRFGMMTVLSRAVNDPAGKQQWLCRCDCGNEKVLRIEFLRHRENPNCGCYTLDQWRLKSTKHGLESNPLYHVRRKMLSRCYEPTDKSYERYGGRGITVCDRWREPGEDGMTGLRNFIEDMQPGYQPGLQIDRIDNDGPYSPENCRWATREENGRNKRNNHLLDSIYGRMTLVELAEKSGLYTGTLRDRERKGYPPELLTIESRIRLDRYLPYLKGEESLWMDEFAEARLNTVINEAEEAIRKVLGRKVGQKTGERYRVFTDSNGVTITEGIAA